MIRRLHALSVALALAGLTTSGCATRLLDDDGGATGADAAMQQPDAAMQANDAAMQQDAGACRDTHELAPVRLARISFPDAASGLWHGAAIRVALAYALRPDCDVPGPVTATVQSAGGVDTVTLLAEVWRSTKSDAACGAVASVTRVLVLSDLVMLSGSTLIVRDLTSGGSFMPQGVEAAPEGPPCGHAGASGSDCLRDCDCDTSTLPLRCVPFGDLKQGGLCVASCSEDADCPDALPSCGATSVPSTCGQGGGCGGGACPFGQSCEMTAGGVGCRPPSQFVDPGGQCLCDGDCKPGAICADHRFGEDSPNFCVFPCATTADCPAHGGCGFACGPDGVCNPEPC